MKTVANGEWKHECVKKINVIFFKTRSQLMLAAYLMLVIFISVMLLVNIIINGIIYSNYWPSFWLFLFVLTLSVVIVKCGFSKISKKKLLLAISIIVSIGLIGTAPLFFTQGIQHALNYANFYFVKDTYLKQISMADRTNAPRFITFKLNGFGKQLMIFDESDELDNQEGIKSRDWWSRAKNREYELAVCDWSSIKVAEHFYRVSFFCERPYSSSPIPPP